MPDLQQRSSLLHCPQQKKHFSSLTKGTLWSVETIRFPQPAFPTLWLMGLKSPPQNENTVLLSAHKHANLKCVFTDCELMVLKLWSYLVSPVMAMLYWSFQMIMNTIIMIIIMLIVIYYYYYFCKCFMETQKLFLHSPCIKPHLFLFL